MSHSTCTINVRYDKHIYLSSAEETAINERNNACTYGSITFLWQNSSEIVCNNRKLDYSSMGQQYNMIKFNSVSDEDKMMKSTIVWMILMANMCSDISPEVTRHVMVKANGVIHDKPLRWPPYTSNNKNIYHRGSFLAHPRSIKLMAKCSWPQVSQNWYTSYFHVGNS